ncbi:MAG: 50S ribosomal protein L21 [Candidatus Aminicenantes bacterium]|nr:MAG: 50S ribosomal protein L21 [Candidatus Aminicenantes bacterium]
MFAVIKTGGKQYRVQVGDILQIEKLIVEEGQKVTFDQVLLIEDNGKTLIGTPFVEDAQVTGEIIENFKDKKVIVFKKKRRKQYKRKRGHRQELTRIKIDEITPSVKAAPKRKPVRVTKEPEKKPVPKKEKPKPVVKTKEVKEKKPKKKETAQVVKKEAPKKAKDKAATKKKTVTKAAATSKKSTLKKEK